MGDYLETIFRARFLVGSLGETASPAWWRSQAAGQAGRQMLQLLFPRTYLAASLNTASRAAAIVHDSRIGRIHGYHLFRLLTPDELALHELAGGERGREILAEVAEQIDSGTAQQALERMASGHVARPEGHGPVHCGSVDGVKRPKTLQEMCGVYAAAFGAGTPAFPYLTESGS